MLLLLVPPELSPQLFETPRFGLVDPFELDVLGLGDGPVIGHDPVEAVDVVEAAVVRGTGGAARGTPETVLVSCVLSVQTYSSTKHFLFAFSLTCPVHDDLLEQVSEQIPVPQEDLLEQGWEQPPAE